MKDEITAYFLKHFRIFEENFRMSKANSDMAAIHKMRVSIKRTRILFELFQVLEPSLFNAKKEFKPVKDLFKTAGVIRDVQVQIKLLDTMEKQLATVFPAYRSFLAGKEKNAIHEFEKKAGRIEVNAELIDIDKITALLTKLNSADGMEKVTALIGKKSARVEELMHEALDDEKIHEVRITLKQIHYLLELSKKRIPSDRFLDMPVERLDALLKLFGEWHDYVNADLFIALFCHQDGEHDNTGQLLKPHILMQKHLLEGQIREVMDNELKFKYGDIPVN